MGDTPAIAGRKAESSPLRKFAESQLHVTPDRRRIRGRWRALVIGIFAGLEQSMKRPLSILSAVILASLMAGCGGGSSGGSGGGGGGGTPQDIPTLTAIAPSGAAVGSAAITMSVYGSNFAQGAVVQWNGATLTAQWISATEMTATVPATDFAAAGSANVTVVNQGSGGGTSATQTFKVTAVPAATTWVRSVPNIVFATNATPYQAANTVWDAAHGKLYLAIPSTASVSPNTIAIIDPIAGTATYSAAVGNNPDLLVDFLGLLLSMGWLGRGQCRATLASAGPY